MTCVASDRQQSEPTVPAQSTPRPYADELHLPCRPRSAAARLESSRGAPRSTRSRWLPRDPRRCESSWPRSPSQRFCSDRQPALAAIAEHPLARTNARAPAPAMAKFIALTAPEGTGHRRSSPTGAAPNPADFGLPTEDDGARDDVLLGQNLVTCTHYEPDFDALRAASTRIVLAAGAESEGELAHRAARGGGRAARDGSRRLPQPPRRLPRRRVRSAGRP